MKKFFLFALIAFIFLPFAAKAETQYMPDVWIGFKMNIRDYHQFSGNVDSLNLSRDSSNREKIYNTGLEAFKKYIVKDAKFDNVAFKYEKDRISIYNKTLKEEKLGYTRSMAQANEIVNKEIVKDYGERAGYFYCEFKVKQSEDIVLYEFSISYSLNSTLTTRMYYRTIEFSTKENIVNALSKELEEGIKAVGESLAALKKFPKASS